MPAPRFDAQTLGDYISQCMKNGGAVTINLGIYQDGSVDPKSKVDATNKEIRQRIRKEQPQKALNSLPCATSPNDSIKINDPTHEGPIAAEKLIYLCPQRNH